MFLGSIVGSDYYGMVCPPATLAYAQWREVGVTIKVSRLGQMICMICMICIIYSHYNS